MQAKATWCLNLHPYFFARRTQGVLAHRAGEFIRSHVSKNKESANHLAPMQAKATWCLNLRPSLSLT